MSVTLENVSRDVNGVSWIRDISFMLVRGTLSVLLGATLSGKTSIMRLLAGLDRPSAGRILVDGKDVTAFDVRKRSVAMVYEQFINYPTLTVFENIGDASSGAKTPQAAMDSLAAAQDSVMERIEKSGVQGVCGPKLNPKQTAEFWFAKAEKDGTIAPQRKLANEKPKGETIDYDALIKSWPASPPKRAAAN